MHPSLPPLTRLQTTYEGWLVSPALGARKGSVAGKETRRGMRQGRIWAQETEIGWTAFQTAWATNPSRVFAWSDHHLGHENLIGYVGRPFGSAAMVDQAMLANAQATVGPTDWLLFVGDLAMWKDPATVEAWMRDCPGRKVLILGNHDLRGHFHPTSSQAWLDLGFEAVAECLVLPANAHAPELWVTHYPLAAHLLPEGVLNVHGHLHDKTLDGPFVNACVEGLDYRPHLLVEMLSRPRQ